MATPTQTTPDSNPDRNHRVGPARGPLPQQLSPVLITAGLVLTGLLAGSHLGRGPGAQARAPQLAPRLRATAASAPKRQIDVDGQARLDVSPDRVDLQLTIETRYDRPLQASNALKKKHEELVVTLTGLGVSEKQMTHNAPRLYPIYKRYSNHVIEAFVASSVLTITLSDFKRLPLFMEAAATVGVQRIGTRFHSTRLVELKNKVRSMALAAARRKAGQMASESGVTLGKVLTLKEGGSSRHMGWQFNSVDNDSGSVSSRQTSRLALRPGAIPLRLRIHATYAID